MTDRSAKYWSDILTAITEIETFIMGVDSLNAYTRDVKTKRAVERSLSIIGEAMGTLARLQPELKVESARAIPARWPGRVCATASSTLTTMWTTRSSGKWCASTCQR